MSGWVRHDRGSSRNSGVMFPVHLILKILAVTLSAWIAVYVVVAPTQNQGTGAYLAAMVGVLFQLFWTCRAWTVPSIALRTGFTVLVTAVVMFVGFGVNVFPALSSIFSSVAGLF